MLSPSILQAPFPTLGQDGAISSDHVIANQLGVEVLQRGGNAIDAALAVSLALGLCCPQYTGIGGGGFALVWMPGWDCVRCLDYRETAPHLATRDMFVCPTGVSQDCCLNERGQVSSTVGGRAVGVPGHLAGWGLLHESFGHLPWREILLLVANQCQKGFEIDANYLRIANAKKKLFEKHPSLGVSAFLAAARPGGHLCNFELANTYGLLAEKGWQAYYQGQLAERQVNACRASGGILQLSDLADYRPQWREPLRGNFRQYEIATCPKPSHGGQQLLDMLAGYQSLHHLSPVTEMSNITHLMRESFARRFQSTKIGEGGTAAFSVSTFDRGVVAVTESVNLWWGSGVVPEQCGFLLNNVMDDFSCYPGQPDAFGLYSCEENAVGPGKRPDSSSCPTIVFERGRPILALGSAGGSRIPTAVFQMLIHLLQHGMNTQQAMTSTRIHHQWQPDFLWVEPQCPEELREKLSHLGHTIQQEECRSHACLTSLDWQAEFATAAGDFRSFGAATGWTVAGQPKQVQPASLDC